MSETEEKPVTGTPKLTIEEARRLYEIEQAAARANREGHARRTGFRIDAFPYYVRHWNRWFDDLMGK